MYCSKTAIVGLQWIDKDRTLQIGYTVATKITLLQMLGFKNNLIYARKLSYNFVFFNILFFMSGTPFECILSIFVSSDI